MTLWLTDDSQPELAAVAWRIGGGSTREVDMGQRAITEADRGGLVAYRYLDYHAKVKCAACGRESRSMLTMLCEFRTPNGGRDDAGSGLPAFTPVCTRYPLVPDWK